MTDMNTMGVRINRTNQSRLDTSKPLSSCCCMAVDKYLTFLWPVDTLGKGDKFLLQFSAREPLSPDEVRDPHALWVCCHPGSASEVQRQTDRQHRRIPRHELKTQS